MTLHSSQGLGEIHIPHQWRYADQTAREAATGFVAGDVGKLAYQEDDDTLWILTAVAPTWVSVGGALAAHASTHQNGGADEVNVAALSGQLADAQLPIVHALFGSYHTIGALAALNALISDATLDTNTAGRIPLDYQSNLSSWRSTTTSTTYQEKVQITTPTLTGTYLAVWSCLVDNSTGELEARLRDQTGGVTLGSTVHLTPNASSDRVPIMMACEVSFSTEARDIAIEYRVGSGGGTTGIKDACIQFWRVS